MVRAKTHLSIQQPLDWRRQNPRSSGRRRALLSIQQLLLKSSDAVSFLVEFALRRFLLGEEIFRDGQSCRTECFSDIRGRIAEAHICELRKAMAAITSDAKRLKTDAPVASKTDDAPIDKAAVDGTAVTGSA